MYSPKIKDEYIHRLYLLGQKLGLPMTVIVNKAIEKLLENAERLGYDIGND